jgi:hypothetical protein
MILVGLGEAGKNIVKLFKPHSKTYKVIIFDENEGLPSQDSTEDYDKHPVKVTSRGLKSHSEAILFVCGSGKVAGASLRVIEAFPDHQMSVVYIVPDLEFASREERLRHRVHFHVLQEFTRSGKIKEMIIMDNKSLLDLNGSGTISNYYEKVNFFIYSTLQNLFYCSNVKPDFGKIHKAKDHARISTLGIAQLQDAEEKMLFALDNITETCYYINIEEEDLDNDETILPSCQQIVRENIAKNRESSFAIWRSSDPNFYISKHFTHFIQDKMLIKQDSSSR